MKPNTDYRLIHLMRTISDFHKEFWHKLAPAFFRLITQIQNDHTTPNMNSAIINLLFKPDLKILCKAFAKR